MLRKRRVIGIYHDARIKGVCGRDVTCLYSMFTSLCIIDDVMAVSWHVECLWRETGFRGLWGARSRGGFSIDCGFEMALPRTDIREWPIEWCQGWMEAPVWFRESGLCEQNESPNPT
jgi:hypothetical protein